MKKVLTGILIVIVLGLAAFFLFRSTESEINFRTEKVIRGDIVDPSRQQAR